MAEFLLERELPNLKVAVDNDDCMDMDESRTGHDSPPAEQQQIEVATKDATTDEMAAEDADDPEDDPAFVAQLQELYQSLKVDAKRPAGTRLNTLHVRGVSNMSTEDVEHFFREYGPSSVDWINDHACNVVWQRPRDAARALLALSRPLRLRRRPKARVSSREAPDTTGQEEEEVVLMSEEDLPGEEEEEVLDVSELEVPLPPGQWRKATLDHPKAKMLLLRFSSKHDRKGPGAEKQSEYYRKYGNPNYGGMTGLISGSRKRRMRRGAASRDPSRSDDEGHGETGRGSGHQRVAKRMRMYADDEEDRLQRRKQATLSDADWAPTPWSSPGRSPPSDEEPRSGTVWDRLSGGRALAMEPRRRSPPPPPLRSRYVDLDDPRLRDDYDPAEEEEDDYDYDYNYGERPHREFGRDDFPGRRSLSSGVSTAGTDLRAKLEKLRQSRSLASERKTRPLRISVARDAV